MATMLYDVVLTVKDYNRIYSNRPLVYFVIAQALRELMDTEFPALRHLQYRARPPRSPAWKYFYDVFDVLSLHQLQRLRLYVRPWDIDRTHGPGLLAHGMGAIAAVLRIIDERMAEFK